MRATEPSACREAATRCREAALASTRPDDWIRVAEKWEWLAETSDAAYLLAKTLVELEEELSAKDTEGSYRLASSSSRLLSDGSLDQFPHRPLAENCRSADC
jgi:hypothetical protein